MSGWTLSPLAFDDLDAILAYVQKESGARPAERLLEDFRAAFDMLAHSPRAGLLRESLTKPSVRWWIVHRYLVLYDSETSPLRIIRVIHGAREIEVLLGA